MLPEARSGRLFALSQPVTFRDFFADDISLKVQTTMHPFHPLVGISVKFRCVVRICTISSVISCANGPSGGPIDALSVLPAV